MSRIFPTYYAAKKERKNNLFYTGAEYIVKVYGGFVIMDEREYQQFKNER